MPATGAIISLITTAWMGFVPPQPAGSAEAWSVWKDRFLMEDGRVVDNRNAGVSHSEGQGYGMLLAVANDDAGAFARIWGWTSINLQLRNDGLMVWRYQPDQAKTTPDLNSASDGDILIAWALARAAGQWQDANYARDARKLARAIRANLVRDVAGSTVLLGGPDWFDHPDHVVVNPSYWIFPAFADLNAIDPSITWGDLEQSGRRLLDKAAFGRRNLPTDWVRLDRSGRARPSDDKNHPQQFGYNAVRVPLYLGWGGGDVADLLKPYSILWPSDADGKRPLVVDVKTGRTVGTMDEPGYRLIPLFVDCVLNGHRIEPGLEGVGPNEGYYPATLNLLTHIALRERYPQCLETSDALPAVP